MFFFEGALGGFDGWDRNYSILGEVEGSEFLGVAGFFGHVWFIFIPNIPLDKMTNVHQFMSGILVCKLD